MAVNRKVRLGDVEVLRVGLGTNRLTPAAAGFIKAAVAAGLQAIDTAHLYTGGDSEKTIGETLSPKPDGLVVATKGGFGKDSTIRQPDALRAEVEESLRRLRTDVIDLYYLHRPLPDTPIEESLAVIKEYRDAGKIRHVGVSQVDVALVERARKVVPIAAVQDHYSIGERKHEDVVDYCEREGIVFVPFFPLHADLGPAGVDVARRHGATHAQVMLAWLLARSPVMLPIPGTLSLQHLEENLAALDLGLTDEELGAIA